MASLVALSVLCTLLLTLGIMSLLYGGDADDDGDMVSNDASGRYIGEGGAYSDTHSFGGLAVNVSASSISVCSKGQHFLLWINGRLVGTGDGCALRFINSSNPVHAPCDKPLLIAIEGQDYEDDETHSVKAAGLLASIEWCGTSIVTDSNWLCSKSPSYLWQSNQADAALNNSALLARQAGILQTLSSLATNAELKHDCINVKLQPITKADINYIEGSYFYPTQPIKTTLPGGKWDVPVGGEDIAKDAEWIWAGPPPPNEKEYTTIDSAYCRYEASCKIHKHGCKEDPHVVTYTLEINDVMHAGMDNFNVEVNAGDSVYDMRRKINQYLMEHYPDDYPFEPPRRADGDINWLDDRLLLIDTPTGPCPDCIAPEGDPNSGTNGRPCKHPLGTTVQSGRACEVGTAL
eukprot:SAG22_NODE_1031_length_5932_cov_2.590948_2_plen_405_part_00